MHQVLRLSATAFAVVALAYLAGLVSAQAPVKQVKLSEKQVEAFISAHKDMAEAFDKMANEKSEAAAQTQLNSIAKKFGFKDHSEYDDVATNIAMVMFGIDPQTKAFTDPPTLAKKELEDAKADKTLPEKERKQLVEELTEQLKTVQPIQHPSNIELVKKYYDKLEPLLQ
jgi:SPX domain protein involved in polyphosphate accumulation